MQAVAKCREFDVCEGLHLELGLRFQVARRVWTANGVSGCFVSDGVGL